MTGRGSVLFCSVLFCSVLFCSVLLLIRNGIDTELEGNAADTNGQKVPTAQEAQEINLYVNGLISYGVGPQVDGRAAMEDEILAAGEGHCGMFAYLFSKELSRRGYYGTTTYCITSRYIGESTADHTVVEVETTEGPYVFDPTHGIYYTTDMATLLSCDNAETYAEGEPSMESYYLTSRFFAETSSLTVYIDARDESDLNLLRWCDGNVSSGIAIQPTDTQDVVYDENLAPNSIVCTFNEEVEFYRIRIGFMEELQAPLDLTCYTVDKTGEKSVLHGNLIQDSYELNYQLDDAAIISKIIIEITGEASLPEIAFFDIYQ